MRELAYPIDHPSVICNTILLIIVFGGNHIDVIYVVPVNLYISIIGVVFATGVLISSTPLITTDLCGKCGTRRTRGHSSRPH
jgi:hypothetical protein